jgi:hypothetical protein
LFWIHSCGNPAVIACEYVWSLCSQAVPEQVATMATTTAQPLRQQTPQPLRAMMMATTVRACVVFAFGALLLIMLNLVCLRGVVILTMY